MGVPRGGQDVARQGEEAVSQQVSGKDHLATVNIRTPISSLVCSAQEPACSLRRSPSTGPARDSLLVDAGRVKSGGFGRTLGQAGEAGAQ